MHHLQQRLARRHGLPLDLKYMRPTFSAVVDALGGQEGLLWLYVLSKLPSARKLWLAKWHGGGMVATRLEAAVWAMQATCREVVAWAIQVMRREAAEWAMQATLLELYGQCWQCFWTWPYGQSW